MTGLVRRTVQLLVMTAVQAVVLFGCAGTIRWPSGWMYVVLYLGLLAITAAVVLPGRRDVVEERSKGLAGGVTWDRYLAPCSWCFSW